MGAAPGAAGAGPPLRHVRLRVEGQVQGVGFRPFVHRLAHGAGLRGTVHNDVQGVSVEVWGAAALLDDFQARLAGEAPALARVDRVTRLEDRAAEPGEAPPDFRIVASGTTPGGRGRVTVDAAVCPECLGEMADPGDRRHRHPLINCTNCGPRYTIVRDLPYDRARTTMAPFAMCPDCAREYRDPADRRFHAQPVCCHACGPRLRLSVAEGEPAEGGARASAEPEEAREARDPAEVEEVLRRVVAVLAEGGVVAMKGLGGYHLVADAANPEAVLRLREVKRRDHKPFALMVGDLEAADALCELSPGARALLSSPASPILLAPWRVGARGGATAGLPEARTPPPGEPVPATMLPVAANAPGHERLGLMLPNTPMQHLLAARWPGPLVMTSANLSDEPLVTDPADARLRMGGGVAAFLDHDRAIERAVDDSVLVDAGGGLPPIPLRRARGFVPAPLGLPVGAILPGLCTGADLKSAVAVVRGGEAVLSQHVGDLTHALAFQRFRRTLEDLERLFDVEPRWVAVDLHPDYLARRHGLERAAAAGSHGEPLEVVEVQHHHAHLASLLAEHGLTGPAVGVVCDGVGYGDDGTAWGGEILVGDLRGYRRAGHLRPLRLPGGDAAARDVGRCGLSWLVDAFGAEEAAGHPLAPVAVPDPRRRESLLSMLAADLRCPPSSGAGRLFDAAASVLGVCDRNHYEAMAGLLLESAALRSGGRPDGDAMLATGGADPFQIDHRPLLRELARRRAAGAPVEDLAWLFHDALADGLARAAVAVAGEGGLDTVGLTGGVFCNVVLTHRVLERLRPSGLRVLVHRQVPPNDGGIALGQAAVAAARLPAKG